MKIQLNSTLIFLRDNNDLIVLLNYFDLKKIEFNRMITMYLQIFYYLHTTLKFLCSIKFTRQKIVCIYQQLINMQQKQKKIQDLKNLLAQAKSRLEAYKNDIQIKDKKIQELTQKIKKTQKYQEKIKLLQNNSLQIMQQYESRLMRYQTTLQQNQKIIQSHQKQQQIINANNKNLGLNIEKLNQIIKKVIFLNVPEIGDLQKLKQGILEIQKTLFLQKGIQDLRKSLNIFINSVLRELQKQKQAKSLFVKKETSYKKQIQTLQANCNELIQQFNKHKQQINNKIIDHKKQLEIQKHQHAKKILKDQQPNLEYIKNLIIKLFIGPIEVSKMSLKVLQTLLKFTEEQCKDIEKKIKR